MGSQWFPTPIQEFQFYDKYSRWLPELGRKEEWPETVDRTLNFYRKYLDDGRISYAQWFELRQATLNLEVMPSMRALQMAGPALDRDNTGLYNCAYLPLSDIQGFAELLYILMQGTGCGFSVEDQFVSCLPRIKKQKRLPIESYRIPDTTEGWCDALKYGMETWYSGRDIRFIYDDIREAGAILATKGGRASGPQPLRELLAFVRDTILSRQGQKLTPLNCNDIACYCGWIVQVGGVRRAATISFSDLDDREMAECKSGEFYRRFKFRSMANNSAVYEEKPTSIEFMEEWLTLAKNGTGERGLFNAALPGPKRRKKNELIRANPCGEIRLQPYQFCNLSIAVARDTDDLASLERKVRLASIYGTIQSTFTHFPYLRAAWKKNCEDERLLGVDITGQRDCYLFNSEGSSQVFKHLKRIAVDTNRVLAEKIGINQSAAVTTGKPSGNSSQLLNCASGIHCRPAEYYIRRMRAGNRTAVASLLKDAGVPWYPEVGHDSANPETIVFEFPVKAPPGAITADKVTAAEQFNYWLDAQKNYAEHSISCSIYVNETEWVSLGARVFDNWDNLSGLSFFPNDHVYQLAPNEPITKEEYERRIAAFPAIDYSKLSQYENAAEDKAAREYACTSGACEL